MQPTRQFRRSQNNLLTGVCGGIAEWYGVDPLFVRVFYVATTAASAVLPGLIIYLVLWFTMPPAQEESKSGNVSQLTKKG